MPRITPDLSLYGLRRGEVLGLRWRDVDLKAGTVTVRQARVLAGYEIVIEDPKSRNEVRALPLDDVLVAALKALKAPGTCREFAWVLAACYRELEYVEGHRTLVLHTTDGQIIRDEIEHAWNVNHAGEIVDSTLDPRLRSVAQSGQAGLEYMEGDPADSWPASIHDVANAMPAAARTRTRTRGKAPGERRRIVEEFGEMFRRDLRPEGAR